MGRKPMWEIKQAATENTVDLYIYGDVEGDSRNWWNNTVVESETSASHFRNELAKYAGTTNINIYINSYGGSVFEGTAIYNQLRRHPAHKTVYIDGFACSIASVIAMAGDEVVMPKNTMMMIHDMWMEICGNARELRKAADDLEQINAVGREAYLQKSAGKLEKESLIQMMTEEKWLTAEECIKYGLADRYAEEDADMSAATEMLQKANLAISQRIKIQESMAAQLKQLTKPVPKKPTGGLMAVLAKI